MKRTLRNVLFWSALIQSSAFAQEVRPTLAISADTVSKSFRKIDKDYFKDYSKSTFDLLEGVEISGYYRFLTNYRVLDVAYPHLENNKKNIFVGDDSQMPQLMLNIRGFATTRTTFGTDLFIYTPLTGAGQSENVKGLNLGVSLYGNFTTDLGNFSVRTGGINWYAMSPFTFQTSKGYNRFSLFERNPWDPYTPTMKSRYNDFYASGSINQDQRWGNQAFQGIIFEGNKLPNDFSFSFLYGKTQLDAGLAAMPNTSYGGRLSKTYAKGKHLVTYNTFNNETYLDSLSNKTAGFNMHTLEFTNNFANFKLYAEVGAGRRFTNAGSNKWGEAISIKLSSTLLDKFPTELHTYRVSSKVFNNSAIFINSSIQQTTDVNSTLTQPVLIAVSSAILPIGQLSNNRQGLEFNTQLNFGKLKTSIGYSNSMEIEALSSKITYGHAFNTLALSRFWRWNFPSNVGPYANLSKIYRSVYETVSVTDLDPVTGLPSNKKYFNTIEIHSKYKTSIANRDLYLFYLGSYNSVQYEFAPVVLFTEKALLRAYYHQVEAYYSLNSKLVWTNYVSYERIIGNYTTRVDVITKRPKNQTGISVATGLDIQLSKATGLYVRERWMNYKDSSFEKDKYKGFETTVELKIFF